MSPIIDLCEWKGLPHIRIRRCRLRNTRVSFLKILSEYGEEHVLDFKSVSHCMVCMCCIQYTLVMLFTCQKRIEFMKMLPNKGICCFITTNSLLCTPVIDIEVIFYFTLIGRIRQRKSTNENRILFLLNGTQKGGRISFILLKMMQALHY